jgi:Ca-activated chloride channel family protein
MTVKIRYKLPESETSSLMTVAASDTSTESSELGFAAAVAEFGMLLRDSEFKGSSSFTAARALAEKHKGTDNHGHRAEFIRLIGAAAGVVRLQATTR